MSPAILLSFLIGYFLILIIIAFATSKKSSDNSTFFIANRNSKWYLVAFGMIGTALSGVTFISVPGEVGAPSGNQFQYFQFVLGNAIGFIIIVMSNNFKETIANYPEMLCERELRLNKLNLSTQ